MRFYKWLTAQRCAFCDSVISDQKIYIVREQMPTGLMNCIAGQEPKLYEAIDCPKCGKQKIIDVYMRPVTDAQDCKEITEILKSEEAGNDE